MDSFGFDPPTAFTAEAPSQRSRARDSMFLSARATIADEDCIQEVRVRNLSAEGLMIDLDRVVPLGSRIDLALRGIGDVSGRVAWCAEGRVGIALDRPIDPQRARRPVGGGTGTPLSAKPRQR